MPLDHQHSVISSSDFISYLCNLNPVYLIFFFEHFSILTWTSLINSLSLILKEILIQRKKFQKYVNWMTNISVIQKKLWESWMPIKFCLNTWALHAMQGCIQYWDIGLEIICNLIHLRGWLVTTFWLRCHLGQCFGTFIFLITHSRYLNRNWELA